MFESDSESEEEGEKKKEKEEPEEEEIPPPTEWNCEFCTFINPMANGACDICGQGRRPAMEDLIDQIKKQKLEEKKAKQAEASKSGPEEGKQQEDEEVKHESFLRLKFLAFDLERFVKTE